MITFTSAQLDAWLTSLLWPLTRVLALLAAAPVLGQARIPVRVRIGLGVAIVIAIAPSLPPLPQIAPAGAYLAFAGGLLGLAFFKKRGLAVATAAALALVAFNPWLLPAGIRYRVDTTFETRSEPLGEYGGVTLEEDLDQSSAGRLMIWRSGLELITDHPLVGVGFGRFQEAIVDYLGRPLDAHNTYLITAAELGLPGLLLLLVNFALLFWIANRVHRRHPDRFVRATALGLLGGLSGLLMANMFGSRLNSTDQTFLLFCAQSGERQQ